MSLTTGLGLGSFVRPPTATDAAMLILLLCLISILPLLMAAADHEKRMAAAALYRRATRDPITGLLNRATFAERSRQRLAASDGELAMLYLDLDQFKLVNSSNGHAAGDELLRNVGNVVRSEAGANALVARIGGDNSRCSSTPAGTRRPRWRLKLTGGIEALPRRGTATCSRSPPASAWCRANRRTPVSTHCCHGPAPPAQRPRNTAAAASA